MLTHDHAASIFDKLRRFASADEIELLISGGRSALTRFANNTIHQNVAEEEYHISVRVSFGGPHRARHHQQARRRQPAPGGAIRRSPGAGAAAGARPAAHAVAGRGPEQRG